jgi:hypothetical protein
MNDEIVVASVPTEAEINIHVSEQIVRAHGSAPGLVSYSALDLIALAKEKPPVPIIDGLLFERDIMLLHAPEESFKSVFILQIAEAIASGRPLLRQWTTSGRQTVGIIETEMHPAALGERLGKMFPGLNPPSNLRFFSEEALKEWRRQDLKGKFNSIAQWMANDDIRVLMIDTANDFFRGEENPSDERSVGEFFDLLRNLAPSATVLVRHDRKKKDIDADCNSNELIRGSAEWKEDPEAILSIHRTDKRTNQVTIDVGKLRYGVKPAPIEAWFDSDSFRLSPLPPLIAILEEGQKTREQLVEECSRRFGVEASLMATMLTGEKRHLRNGQQGHNATFELDPVASAEAPWSSFLTFPGT